MTEISVLPSDSSSHSNMGSMPSTPLRRHSIVPARKLLRNGWTPATRHLIFFRFFPRTIGASCLTTEKDPCEKIVQVRPVSEHSRSEIYVEINCEKRGAKRMVRRMVRDTNIKSAQDNPSTRLWVSRRNMWSLYHSRSQNEIYVVYHSAACCQVACGQMRRCRWLLFLDSSACRYILGI